MPVLAGISFFGNADVILAGRPLLSGNGFEPHIPARPVDVGQHVPIFSIPIHGRQSSVCPKPDLETMRSGFLSD